MNLSFRKWVPKYQVEKICCVNLFALFYTILSFILVQINIVKLLIFFKKYLAQDNRFILVWSVASYSLTLLKHDMLGNLNKDGDGAGLGG
jgi:hypothetical protein